MVTLQYKRLGTVFGGIAGDYNNQNSNKRYEDNGVNDSSQISSD